MSSEVRKAGQSEWVEGAGRLGLAAKGGSYILVAILAIEVAVGAAGKPADRQGALDALADEPFGWVPIILLAAGFAGYALWRFAQSFADRDREGDDPVGLAKRAGDLAKGLLYAGFAVLAVMIVAGSDSGGSEEDTATSWILDLPLGRWIVGAIGLGVLGAGAFNAYRAVTLTFLEKVQLRKMTKREERWFSALGVFGYLARGVVFALVGAFLIRAAYQYDPQEAIGLDGALAKLAQERAGPILLGVVAFGLLAYGLVCLVEARYREV